MAMATRPLTDTIKKASDGRSSATDELRSSDATARLLLDNIRDYAIYMLDPTGRVMSWSAGAEVMKGYTAAEILGKHFLPPKKIGKLPSQFANCSPLWTGVSNWKAGA